MTSRLLTAIFSYNRGQLLENCVRSASTFSPETPIVIFDDRSDDPETLDVLERASAAGHRVDVAPRTESHAHGNLYANMRRALEMGRDEGYQFVHFVQDDLQFVWHQPDLAASLDAMFERDPATYLIHTHFWMRLGAIAVEPGDELRWYDIPHGGDIGVFHVQRTLRDDFVFGPTEREWKARARALGMTAHALGDPVVARVPWPMHARHRHMLGTPKKTEAPFLLRPLSEAEIAQMRSRDLRRAPYGEDWIEPWGWRCLRPYPISPSRRSWLKAVVLTAARRRSIVGLVPSVAGTRRVQT